MELGPGGRRIHEHHHRPDLPADVEHRRTTPHRVVHRVVHHAVNHRCVTVVTVVRVVVVMVVMTGAVGVGVHRRAPHTDNGCTS